MNLSPVGLESVVGEEAPAAESSRGGASETLLFLSLFDVLIQKVLRMRANLDIDGGICKFGT